MCRSAVGGAPKVVGGKENLGAVIDCRCSAAYSSFSIYPSSTRLWLGISWVKQSNQCAMEYKSRVSNTHGAIGARVEVVLLKMPYPLQRFGRHGRVSDN
jgi:hypothetical protein